MHDTITGPVFQEMLIFGAASIAKEKQSINDLNVFPVPDGDTGTNMSLTMHAAAQELQKRSPATVDLASSITASALLRGARGNSGVILSLLFRGMSKSLKGCVTADGCTFAAAMQEGVSAAYNAVMKPAEGTILTVSRLAADRAMAASAEKNSVEYVIEQAISQGEETLRQTVDMNPVLKKAGVVDAGGKGFLVILKGMLAALRGETMPTLETEHATRDKADFASVGDEDITFAFDTVFIVRRIDDRSIEPFREFLNGIGDSLVIGEDDEAFKVHVHTDTPGVALTEAQRYGTLELAKIENMTGLHRLDEILPLADVVVIARGDLGNAMPLWELPRAQTLIASKCRAAKCPFMVSTQMLHSMHHTAVPTRAEVTDVYQAARSGADYLLLTGETAVGEYPVEAMTYFAKIAANGWADAE